MVFDEKDIDDEGERDAIGVMAEEAWGVSKMVTMKGKGTGEFFISEATGLRETIEATGDANDGAVTGPDDTRAITGDAIRRDLFTRDPNEFIVLR